jgi:hypothetical protein
VLRLRGRAFPRLSRPAAWVFSGLSAVCVVLALVLPPLIRPPPATKRPSSDAVIRIASPPAGSVFHGHPATVPTRLQLIGGTIVPRTSTRLARDLGHIHLYLDGALVSMQYALQDRLQVVPGTHRLTAEFVALDHAPFAPRVLASTTFTVVG